MIRTGQAGFSPSRNLPLHSSLYLDTYTVELVYKDHPRNQQNVVLIVTADILAHQVLLNRVPEQATEDSVRYQIYY